MSIVSSFNQLCQTIRSLAYDNKNPRHRGRANLCLEALTKATSGLADTMGQHSLLKVSPSRSMDSLSVCSDAGSLSSTT